MQVQLKRNYPPLMRQISTIVGLDRVAGKLPVSPDIPDHFLLMEHALTHA